MLEKERERKKRWSDSKLLVFCYDCSNFYFSCGQVQEYTVSMIATFRQTQSYSLAKKKNVKEYLFRPCHWQIHVFIRAFRTMSANQTKKQKMLSTSAHSKLLSFLFLLLLMLLPLEECINKHSFQRGTLNYLQHATRSRTRNH